MAYARKTPQSYWRPLLATKLATNVVEFFFESEATYSSKWKGKETADSAIATTDIERPTMLGPGCFIFLMELAQLGRRAHGDTDCATKKSVETLDPQHLTGENSAEVA